MRKRALLEAAGDELLLWCPNCREQIVRTKGQFALPTLALAEVQHIQVCSPL